MTWSERVNMLSIHPDAGDRDDIARLASELVEARLSLTSRELDALDFVATHARSTLQTCFRSLKQIVANLCVLESCVRRLTGGEND